MSNETDDALLARYRAGDQQAFGDLVIRYQRALYNAALWIVRNADDARDVTQEVFLKVAVRTVGDRQTELVHDFFEGFAMAARANVHMKVLYGRSNHHKIEAVFKAFARALRVACAKDRQLGRMLPSTKGLL